MASPVDSSLWGHRITFFPKDCPEKDSEQPCEEVGVADYVPEGQSASKVQPKKVKRQVDDVVSGVKAFIKTQIKDGGFQVATLTHESYLNPPTPHNDYGMKFVYDARKWSWLDPKRTYSKGATYAFVNFIDNGRDGRIDAALFVFSKNRWEQGTVKETPSGDRVYVDYVGGHQGFTALDPIVAALGVAMRTPLRLENDFTNRD